MNQLKNWGLVLLFSYATGALAGHAPVDPLSNPPGWHEAVGSYSKKVSGFYLQHFDRAKDLKDASCQTFSQRVLRGGAPVFDGSNQWLQKLQANRVRRVFDLREETSNATAERDALLLRGIGYVKFPLRTSGTDQRAQMLVEVGTPAAQPGGVATIEKKMMPKVEAALYVLELMNEVLDHSEEGIFLHCQRGEDRTGLMIALLRDCAGNAWQNEFRTYGGVMYKPLQKLMNDVQAVRH